jgi:hypothetical protein
MSSDTLETVILVGIHRHQSPLLSVRQAFQRQGHEADQASRDGLLARSVCR